MYDGTKRGVRRWHRIPGGPDKVAGLGPNCSYAAVWLTEAIRSRHAKTATGWFPSFSEAIQKAAAQRMQTLA